MYELNVEDSMSRVDMDIVLAYGGKTVQIGSLTEGFHPFIMGSRMHDIPYEVFAIVFRRDFFVDNVHVT
jgi:hypothetical protein